MSGRMDRVRLPDNIIDNVRELSREVARLSARLSIIEHFTVTQSRQGQQKELSVTFSGEEDDASPGGAARISFATAAQQTLDGTEYLPAAAMAIESVIAEDADGNVLETARVFFDAPTVRARSRVEAGDVMVTPYIVLSEADPEGGDTGAQWDVTLELVGGNPVMTITETE